VICAPMCRSVVPPNLINSFGDIRFAQGYRDVGSLQPDILIGMDQYYKFMTPSIVSSSLSGLFAQSSVCV
jgi:hypothetical protein